MIVRKAQKNINDCKIVFNLSNDPIVRMESFNSNQITYENHQKWYYDAVSSKEIIFLLAFENDSFIGQIRFKKDNENTNKAIISISIVSEFRGKHKGSEMIKLAVDELKREWTTCNEVIAEVKFDNVASNILFERNNFRLSSEQKCNVWIRKI